jgi:hypothetical protein
VGCRASAQARPDPTEDTETYLGIHHPHWVYETVRRARTSWSRWANGPSLGDRGWVSGDSAPSEIIPLPYRPGSGRQLPVNPLSFGGFSASGEVQPVRATV